MKILWKVNIDSTKVNEALRRARVEVSKKSVLNFFNRGKVGGKILLVWELTIQVRTGRGRKNSYLYLLVHQEGARNLTFKKLGLGLRHFLLKNSELCFSPILLWRQKWFWWCQRIVISTNLAGLFGVEGHSLKAIHFCDNNFVSLVDLWWSWWPSAKVSW